MNKRLISKSLLGLAMVVIFSPLLVAHFEVLGSRAHYRPYPLLLLFIAVIFIIRYRKAPAATDLPPTYTARWMLVIALMLMPIAYLYFSSWPAAFAAVLVIGAAALDISSKKRVKNLFGIWCLFWLFVRPPDQIEGRYLRLLQDLSAKTGSMMLDFIGVPNNLQGDILALLEHDIKLGPLCNGPISPVSMVVITAVLMVLRNRRIFHVITMLLASIFMAWLLNALRVFAVGALYANFGWDLMTGVPYGVMIAVSFIVSLLMVATLDSLMSFLLQRIITEGYKLHVKMSRITQMLVRLWDAVMTFSLSKWLATFRVHEHKHLSPWLRRSLLGVVSVFLLGLMAFEGVILYYRQGDYASKQMQEKRDLAWVGSEDVVFIRPGWKVLDYYEETRPFDSLWGSFSHIWRLRYNDVMVVMALDYPFNKWHDVKRCYTIQGWEIQDENIIHDSKSFRWGVSQTNLVLPTGDHGFILCSHCDHLGETVEPKPTTHDFSMVKHYLKPARWSAPFGVAENKNKNTFYQTQAMVTSYYELNEETKEEIRQMYADFREQCRRKIEKHARKQMAR